jgi:hypothetical protein
MLNATKKNSRRKNCWKEINPRKGFEGKSSSQENLVFVGQC